MNALWTIPTSMFTHHWPETTVERLLTWINKGDYHLRTISPLLTLISLKWTPACLLSSEKWRTNRNLHQQIQVFRWAPTKIACPRMRKFHHLKNLFVNLVQLTLLVNRSDNRYQNNNVLLILKANQSMFPLRSIVCLDLIKKSQVRKRDQDLLRLLLKDNLTIAKQTIERMIKDIEEAKPSIKIDLNKNK
jgi:hypothetical protein